MDEFIKGKQSLIQIELQDLNDTTLQREEKQPKSECGLCIENVACVSNEENSNLNSNQAKTDASVLVSHKVRNYNLIQIIYIYIYIFIKTDKQ